MSVPNAPAGAALRGGRCIDAGGYAAGPTLTPAGGRASNKWA